MEISTALQVQEPSLNILRIARFLQYETSLPGREVVNYSANDLGSRGSFLPEDLAVPGVPQTPEYSKQNRRPQVAV